MNGEGCGGSCACYGPAGPRVQNVSDCCMEFCSIVIRWALFYSPSRLMGEVESST